jgi:hypothetical protein
MQFSSLVARLTSPDGQHLGTAFAVSDRCLITCQHCLPNPDPLTRFHATFHQANAVQVSCRLAHLHPSPSVDLAVLYADAPLPTLEGLAVGTLDSLQPNEHWSAFGYPASAPTTGQSLSGVVHLPKYSHGGFDSWILLGCEQGNEYLSGASGSPIIVRDSVVAVLSNQRQVPDGAILRPGFHTTLAIPIDRLRDTFFRIDLARLSDPCSRSTREPGVTSELLVDGEHSTLFYVIANVQNNLMEECKAFLNRLTLDLGEFGHLRQVAIWSLLGSAELLFQVRGIPAQFVPFLNFLKREMPGVSTRKTQLRHFTACTEERAERTTKPPLQLAQSKVRCINYSYYKESRTIKAFLHLRVRKGEGRVDDAEYYSQVKRCVESTAAEYIDVVSAADDFSQIMIEVTFPCGRFDFLNKLTESMEPGFDRGDFAKSTFLAYHLTGIPNALHGIVSK